MAGVNVQHRLQPSWDPGLTIAHLSLPHLLSQGLSAAVIDVDRTLLPGRDVTLPEPVLAWLTDAKRLLSLQQYFLHLMFVHRPVAVLVERPQVQRREGAAHLALR